MKINYVIKQSKPYKRTINEAEEDQFSKFFWQTVGAVRNGQYKVDDFNSVAEKVEEERQCRNGFNI